MILLNGSPINVTIFPDKTSQVWHLPEEILKQSNYAHITWEFESEAEFMHLAQLKDLLDKHHFKSDLKITYLPYARQDKDIGNNQTFALLTFSKLLNSLEFNSISIMDPHSAAAIYDIKNSIDKYPIDKVLGIAFELESDLFCYPDEGATDKYATIYDYPCTFGKKVRDQATGKITSYKLTGNVKDQKVLIVDDICDGGATFLLLAKELYAAGAKEVNLFVTHGLFTNGLKPLLDSGIKRIFTQNGEVTTIVND